VLPRLYRDAIVYESWEGSHNVLVAQILNDLRRLPILDVVAYRLRRCLEGATDHDLVAQVQKGLDEALDTARQCISDATFGMWHFRDLVDRIGVLAEASFLAEAGEDSMAHYLILRHVTDGYRPEGDTNLKARVEAILSSMG
jgi:hypothetical protein